MNAGVSRWIGSCRVTRLAILATQMGDCLFWAVFFGNYKIVLVYFFHGRRYALNITKNVLGYIFGRLVHNSSGHSDHSELTKLKTLVTPTARLNPFNKLEKKIQLRSTQTLNNFQSQNSY
jgi:hypothetical protein